MSISLTHVKKSYVIDNQSHTVINIPEFKVENGGKMAIVGRSGSGKSTLLNLISGILLPDDGQITIKDTDLNRLSEPERDLFRAQTIGFVFQTFNLLQGLTAEENVALAMSFAGKQGQALHQAKTLLKKVGLGNKSHHKPRQLSVGEQQRVALARAISNNPHIILADEPTANLDEQSAEIVMDLLMELSQAEDRILLVVTHEKEIAQKLPEQLLLSTLNQVQHT
jgi:putative ABC transport system ATP-binding protein